MGLGVGARELVYVIAVALAGVVLAVTAALTPWYPGPSVPNAPVVKVVTPGGVAGQP